MSDRDIFDYLEDEEIYIPQEVPLLDALMVWSGFVSEPVEEDT